MIPNLRIRNMTNKTLIEELEKEIIAVGAQKYGDHQYFLPKFNKRNINMLKTELLKRMSDYASSDFKK